MITLWQCLLLAVCICKSYSAGSPKIQSVELDQGSYVIKDGVDKDNAVSWASYSNEINKTGWASLEVYTSKKFSNDEQAYAAGLIEGHMTRDLISDHFHNTYESYCKEMTTYCQKLKDFIEGNTEYVKEQINANPDWTYTEQVKLFYYQYSGLKDGYNAQAGQPRVETDMGLYLLQIAGDLEDLEASLGKEDYRPTPGNGHCSALIKLLPGNKDLYVAQDTWNGYGSMLRVLKKYSFEYYTNSSKKEMVPGDTMTFSSYPGILMSGDDFYVISTGLVTLETTIGNSNPALYKYQGVTNSFLEGVRCMLANRLAVSGYSWAYWFTFSNSGTYNNQWMIVDYNMFKQNYDGKEGSLKEGLLYVVEQVPGVARFEDLTDLLANQTYFPSFNIPYFEYIFNISGGYDNVKKYGDWFSYKGSPRYQIFNRDHSKVKDTTSMLKLMRYNDYQHDTLSRCKCTPPYSAENAISARSDLNPANGSYPFGALGHRLHGGIDMKMTSVSMAKTLDFIAVSSPTYDNVPPFQWSKSDWKDTAHRGQPDLWKFQPITTKWGKK